MVDSACHNDGKYEWLMVSVLGIGMVLKMIKMQGEGENGWE